jgi:hypothetical protein
MKWVRMGFTLGGAFWELDQRHAVGVFELGLDIRFQVGGPFSVGIASGYAEYRSLVLPLSGSPDDEIRLYPLPISASLYWEAIEVWSIIPTVHLGYEMMTYELRNKAGHLAYGKSLSIPGGIEFRSAKLPLSLDIIYKALDDLTDGKPTGNDHVWILRIGVFTSLFNN